MSLVFVSGCFDLLHEGHRRFLLAARELGDELIIALNSDQSVRRLKGASRPIEPCAERRRKLERLRLGPVIPLTDDSPVTLLYQWTPNILAKGRYADHLPADVAFACQELGIVVHYTGELARCSTTGILNGQALPQG